MSSTFINTARMEPNHARLPPHVPAYPNPPAYFRRTLAEHYTRPEGKAAYHKWSDKWHVVQPDWRDEHYRIDSRTPVMRCIEFQPGTLRPAYTASWDRPAWRQEYQRQGRPDTEAVRARGINRVYWTLKDRNLYKFSNNMTSTQYQKPVTACYGPLLREQVYGLNTQHNRHGFMPAQDYYF